MVTAGGLPNSGFRVGTEENSWTRAGGGGRGARFLLHPGLALCLQAASVHRPFCSRFRFVLEMGGPCTGIYYAFQTF